MSNSGKQCSEAGLISRTLNVTSRLYRQFVCLFADMAQRLFQVPGVWDDAQHAHLQGLREAALLRSVSINRGKRGMLAPFNMIGIILARYKGNVSPV